MKAEMVDICKAVGNRIGAYCRENDDKGILFQYEMPKAELSFLTYWPKLSFEPECLIAKLFQGAT